MQDLKNEIRKILGSMSEKELTALEALERIKEAEAKAKEILEAVQTKDIPMIMAQASEKAKAIKEQILAQAKEEAGKRKEAILAQAKQEVETIKRETEREIDKIEKIAQEKLALLWPSISQKIIEAIKEFKVD